MFHGGYADGNKIKASCLDLRCIRSPGKCFPPVNGTLFALWGNYTFTDLQSLLRGSTDDSEVAGQGVSPPRAWEVGMGKRAELRT